MAAQVTGISSMATRQILTELCDAYRKKTGQTVAIESVGGVDATKRVRAGEAFDIIVLADDALKQLEAEGFLKAGSRAGFANSATAVAIRAGAERPDLSNEASLKAAVLAAKSIGYSTGPSGTHVLNLLKNWGIEQVVAERLVKASPGIPVGSLVARGEAELGFQQLSEFLDVPGIEIAGPLPSEVQSVTLFACGVCAQAANEAGARELVTYLTSRDAEAPKRRHGMEPA
ncbi:ABC transporter substrate-binding protein [Bradyrhizobium sp. INPA01-394B]|uniref:Substrate-binding domain-containing protein n=1 Tax=Bradyrhizobium campsiandrae TaxID=1729892 RepID=A0ABR7UHG6_9BRAD|nr:substrate-binding domain-containing protein [Bradyrhizobium campsiandrae]MBC9882503.1 ABC transporter substrate-binding protein [Bradyrhizobium campsiandrae]MBC9983380.1 substrate-binding domain-containing protein [Bradyrhizobium campsiandrae]